MPVTIGIEKGPRSGDAPRYRRWGRGYVASSTIVLILVEAGVQCLVMRIIIIEAPSDAPKGAFLLESSVQGMYQLKYTTEITNGILLVQ
ncbi:hypothetical protein BDZ94DRAFT_1254488 [Collybia nuda]|uniref:Uncharacterized protein n=1 Tax=Collybia nuda TaxID=64659 RepID=A0A9P6CK88_9AGAR|nr:hypothetical protein BDZ94DRAFT_1254488 [Collybia nuda]